jgi:spermidine synthase
MPSRTDRRWTRPLLLAIFFLSGASGLIYEIAWTRRLTLIFGSTTLAVSTVLAAFMGGLALGSYRLGRRADEGPSRALGLYGKLELAIAGAALLVPVLLRATQAAYLELAPRLESFPQLFFLVQFLLVGAVLVIPTAAMGGTLPALSRWLVRDPAGIGMNVAVLYAVNTVGAGAGTAAAIYFLIPFEGVTRTEWVAVAVNTGVGLTALLIDRQTRTPRDRADARTREAPEAAAVLPSRIEKPHSSSPAARALLAAVALSGFAAMADEVAWSRLLALVLGSSVYSFGLMLIVVLGGLAIGSSIFARMRSGQEVRVLGAALAANTVAAFVSIVWVPHLPTLFLRAFPVARVSFLLLQLTNLLLTCGLVLPSAILFGVAFPATVAATTEFARAGTGVGRVTVFNTIGTVSGAFAAGFVLIPYVGLRATLTVAALATALGATLCAPQIVSQALKRTIRIGVAAALLLTLVWPAWPLRLLVMGAGFYAPVYSSPADLLAAAEQSQLLFYRDGFATTLSVDQQGEYRYYKSNGKTDASTHPGDMANQLLLGHLPMLLHPDPQDLFVLGLGTGVSAAAMARYPVRSIEIADIEGAAREATKMFATENRDILADPRVRFLHADGRNALLARRRLYDVILSDPSDVWVAGVGNLLTREFYSLARTRLKPQGIMVQWFHMHSLLPEQLKLLVATFRSVFPNTSLWRPNHGDVILMGTVDLLPWDSVRLGDRVARVPGVGADLQSMGIWDPLAIFAPFVLEGDDLKRLLADVHGVHTDDEPVLEYLSPRAAYVDTTTENDAGVQAFQTVFVPPMTRFDPEKQMTPRVTYLLGFGHASLGRTDSAIRLMEDALAREPTNPKYWIGLGNQYRVKDWRSRAADAYRRAIALVPGEAEASEDLAALLRADRDDAGAEKVLRDGLAAAPDDPVLLAAMSRLLLDTGRSAQVYPLLSPTLSRKTKNAELHLLAGLALAATGNARQADAELRMACVLGQDNAALLRTAGKALLELGNLPEATAACTRADLLEPGNPETLATLAEISRRRDETQGDRTTRERPGQTAPVGPAR